MKQLKFLTIALLGAAAVNLASCNNDDAVYYGPVYANALVTVKPNPDNSDFYMQLDDSTTLKAVNLKKSPFGTKEVRALANISYANADAGEYDKSVFINWIDSILTKNTAPDLNEENIAAYGNDPVEIVKDWVTIAEDGYLTLHFYTRWGNSGISHELNLVTGLNPEDPYEVRFTHNAHGDGTYYEGDGIVAFRLQDLPDTKGETVKLTLKYDSFDREKTIEFDYCTREDWSSGGDTSSDGE